MAYQDISSLRIQRSGLNPGAEPDTRDRVRAQINPSSSTLNTTVDWRVNLAIPDVIRGGPIFQPFSTTNNRMVFPFNPTIVYSHTTNYNTITPTHSNYPFYAYQNSQVDQIQITGEFYSENEADARYWIACIHFLRTITKMFYGNGEYLGNPPPLSRLNGYGKHVLNDIPVLVTNFTVDMPADVDYIPCSVAGGGDLNSEIPEIAAGSDSINYVPVQSTITVTVVPNYARASHSEFNLKTFARGGFIGDEKGFI